MLKIEKEFRTIEELYCYLYVERMETLKDRKEHEKLLRYYIDRGFTQYDAMVNLIVSDERVKRKDDGKYIFLDDVRYKNSIQLSVV